MSCGGLYACLVAAMFPELISALYIDAPVMNLLSCPCDLGVAQSNLFEDFYSARKITKSELLSYRGNPIDKMDILLKNDIPVVMVAGDRKFAPRRFLELLNIQFSAQDMAFIPHSSDQVTVGDIERLRLSDKKVVFVKLKL